MKDALSPAESGHVAAAVRGLREQGDSGFVLLKRADEAFNWRLALVDSATESIDIKYFIWHGNESGDLLFVRVLEAAERGVRVRMLIDDLNLAATVEELSGVAGHPNVEIRLFNPTPSRSIPGALGDYARSFSEMNRRMHNKVLVADGQMAIVGGRNVANEYFGLSPKCNFLDLDVLVGGPIVDQISAAFDEYWNADLSRSAVDLAPAAPAVPLPELITAEHTKVAEVADILQSYPIDRADWSNDLEKLADQWHLGVAQYIQDHPVKTGEEPERVPDMVDRIAPETQQELTIFSPYLIPDQDFLTAVEEIADGGTWVRVVTGTKAAVNHTAAYAHYEKYLDAILDTGAESYEIDAQPSAEVHAAADVAPVANERIALHLKGMVSDRRYCFIGSLNFDPRAVIINTENGLLIDSPSLGEELAEWFDELLSPENAWHVTRDPSGKLWWVGKDEKRPNSPHRGNLQRIMARFFRILPIESQL